jgi:hypothetical protein
MRRLEGEIRARRPPDEPESDDARWRYGCRPCTLRSCDPACRSWASSEEQSTRPMNALGLRVACLHVSNCSSRLWTEALADSSRCKYASRRARSSAALGNLVALDASGEPVDVADDGLAGRRDSFFEPSMSTSLPVIERPSPFARRRASLPMVSGSSSTDLPTDSRRAFSFFATSASDCVFPDAGRSRPTRTNPTHPSERERNSRFECWRIFSV